MTHSLRRAVPFAFTLAVAFSLSHDAFGEPPENPPWEADPALVERLSKSRSEFNYSESAVPDYRLPNPLVMENGQPVMSAEDWHQRRRPELIELFREHVYGRPPKLDYQVRCETVRQIDGALSDKAIGREMRVVITAAQGEYSFPVLAMIPKNSAGPVPAVILIHNRGTPTLEEASTTPDGFWPTEQIIDAGFATLAFHTSDVDPDRKDGYAEGIRGWFEPDGQDRPDRWGSLSAWGWGASRILDCLAEMPEIDEHRVAVAGHSRGGKAALWAAARDPRFIAAYSNDSGCGGAALSRRAYGETIDRITSSFPHWFAPNLNKYAGRESELPVDQHQLIALIAPRQVYVASASEDLWADPRGEYTALVEAGPVFRLLDREAISQPQMPALDQPRHVGATGYHIREGGHNLTPQDWRFFLDFLTARLPDPS